MHFIITQGYLSPCLRIITQGYGPECSAGGVVAPAPQTRQDRCLRLWTVSDGLDPKQTSHETICFKLKDKTTVKFGEIEVIDMTSREVTGVRIEADTIIVTTRGNQRGNK